MERLAEMLNFSDLNTDANREILSTADDSDLGGQSHTIPFSQRLNQTIGAADRHLDGACVVLQSEGGISASPS
jgi:hypothetical protein